ncbi:hypothetical protein B0H14DRAFT_3494485 [Mycena olivaceomarginata]|nr:hypothetical protein B0H14DRAFT_3494485 [Mycena olivaceomarginata]
MLLSVAMGFEISLARETSTKAFLSQETEITHEDNPHDEWSYCLFNKANIDTWLASSYAPRRDANESRADYEQRLTLVTRKAPLSEACSKLSTKVPKTATLERLRHELAKYWFTQASSRPAATSQAHTTSVPSRQRRTPTLR